jgi:hypothetical protein
MKFVAMTLEQGDSTTDASVINEFARRAVAVAEGQESRGARGWLRRISTTNMRRGSDARRDVLRAERWAFGGVAVREGL